MHQTRISYLRDKSRVGVVRFLFSTGDIDENGELNANDATVAKEVAVKVTEATTLSDEALTAADLDGNGVITTNEARKIKRTLLEEITLD